MATPVAEAVAQQMPRRFGRKQVLLPNHVIAFIRPKPRQPPNLATFVVPLKFNKLDMRDYLYHGYNVEVTAVRSFINQPEPRKRNGTTGKVYRPRAQKMMIAELVKPFVWPSPPVDEELKPWDNDMFTKLQKERNSQMERQMNPSNVPVRTEKREAKERTTLREQAKEFMENGGWSNGRTDKWKEVEEEVTV
ncbi:mitochondrial 54S ribosomal protein YmL41 [Collariella sp. IMI 366227]|nr:mitochondrial 54S ribosomal protein YmL41 [Collariella sp. IMI 366227]